MIILHQNNRKSKLVILMKRLSFWASDITRLSGITMLFLMCYDIIKSSGLSAVVARTPGGREVASSILVAPTKSKEPSGCLDFFDSAFGAIRQQFYGA